MLDLYQLLELDRKATDKDIKKAYRKLALKYHPEKNLGDEEALSKFKLIKDAYNILSSPEKKAEYDRKHPQKQQIKVEITYAEHLTGVTKTLDIKSKCEICGGLGFSGWEACHSCFGSGKTFHKEIPFNSFLPCRDCNSTGRANKIKCICGGKTKVYIPPNTTKLLLDDFEIIISIKQSEIALTYPQLILGIGCPPNTPPNTTINGVRFTLKMPVITPEYKKLLLELNEL